MTDNPPVVDNTGDGVQPDRGAGPFPIPELPDLEAVGEPAQPEVTDEDRQTYGRLLDSAMERGLLSPYDYETRLQDLAEAPTIEELKRIVTELPIFTDSAPASKPRRSSLFAGSPSPDPEEGLPITLGGAHSRMTGGATRSRSNRWTKLIILLIVVIALFIALSIYAEHLAHNRNNSSIAPAAWTALAAPPWLGNPANPRNPRNPASLAGTTTLRP
jgi:hypothetical protein